MHDPLCPRKVGRLGCHARRLAFIPRAVTGWHGQPGLVERQEVAYDIPRRGPVPLPVVGSSLVRRGSRGLCHATPPPPQVRANPCIKGVAEELRSLPRHAGAPQGCAMTGHHRRFRALLNTHPCWCEQTLPAKVHDLPGEARNAAQQLTPAPRYGEEVPLISASPARLDSPSHAWWPPSPSIMPSTVAATCADQQQRCQPDFNPQTGFPPAASAHEQDTALSVLASRLSHEQASSSAPIR